MPTGGRPSGWKLELRPTESQDPGRAAGLQTEIRKPSFLAQRNICRWSRGEALLSGVGIPSKPGPPMGVEAECIPPSFWES